MAKTLVKKEKTKTLSTAPKEFDRDLSRARGSGWVVKDEGVTVCGRLINRVVLGPGLDGKPKSFFQILLREGYPVEVSTLNDDDEKIQVTAESGEIVNLDSSAALDRLHDFCGDGGVYDVWIRFAEKISLKGGLSYWPAEVKIKVVKTAQSKKDDTIPF